MADLITRARAAATVTTDKRGFARIVGGNVDIGAFESRGTPSTTTATGSTFTYDGNAHAGSGTVDVPGGFVTLSYVGINGTVYFSATPPTNAGTYTVTATYAGDDTHEFSRASALLTINRATLTGDATTQDALNLAKQGKLTITVSNFAGLVNGDTLAGFSYYITIGTAQYEFVPTAVTTSGSKITITYSLKNPALLTALSTHLAGHTSAATAVSAGFLMESLNYSFADDDLTRLFCTGR